MAKKSERRYFLIAYHGGNASPNGYAVGNLRMSANGMPSNGWIRDELLKTEGVKNAVVTSIFEFKSKADFDSFGAESLKQEAKK